MSNCYSCPAELTPQNTTDEHVFQNSIGGRLKSPLLCKDCNSGWAAKLDAVFAEAMNTFCCLLNIRRERGEPNSIPGALVEAGKDVLLAPDGNARPRKDEVKCTPQGTEIRYEISASDSRSAKKHLRGLKRKYPKLDYDQALKDIKTDPKPFTDVFKGEIFSIEKEEVYRAVAKIAITFYLHTGGTREQIAHLLNYLKSGEGTRPTHYFYPDNPIFDEKNFDAIHHILLIGDSKEKILYAVISLFNTLNYVVILDDHYAGSTLSYYHNVDPCLGHSSARSAVRIPSRSEIESGIVVGVVDAIMARLNRFMRIVVGRRGTSSQINDIINRAFQENPIQDEPMEFYAARVTEAIVASMEPLIRAAGEARRKETALLFQQKGPG